MCHAHCFGSRRCFVLYQVRAIIGGLIYDDSYFTFMLGATLPVYSGASFEPSGVNSTEAPFQKVNLRSARRPSAVNQRSRSPGSTYLAQVASFWQHLGA